MPVGRDVSSPGVVAVHRCVGEAAVEEHRVLLLVHCHVASDERHVVVEVCKHWEGVDRRL